MAWSSDFLENHRGRARTSFHRKAEALGVSQAQGGKAAERARAAFDRGQAVQQRATASFERHRQSWVSAEYRKLQLKSWSGQKDLRPKWAVRENGLMQKAEKNVFDRHKGRLSKIENITRREINRITREHGKSRVRKR